MRRIVTFTGAVISFAAAALVYLTAGAAPGDIICAKPVVDAGVATPAVKTALVAAVSPIAPGIEPANLDWVLCGQRLPKNVGVWFCRSGEEATLTDAEWASADMGRMLTSATETAATVKQYGPRKLTDADKVLWDAVTQEAFGSPLDGVRWFRFYRSNPGDKSVISMEWEEIVAMSAADYKVARQTDPPTCQRGFGIVE